MTTITKGAALRIALAARVLEGVDTRAFTQWVVQKLGLPVNEDKLSALTVTDLKQALTAEETQETSIETDVDMESLKLAVRYLWGENVDADDDLPASRPTPRATCPAACAWPWHPTKTRTWTATSAPPCVS